MDHIVFWEREKRTKKHGRLGTCEQKWHANEDIRPWKTTWWRNSKCQEWAFVASGACPVSWQPMSTAEPKQGLLIDDSAWLAKGISNSCSDYSICTPAAVQSWMPAFFAALLLFYPGCSIPNFSTGFPTQALIPWLCLLALAPTSRHDCPCPGLWHQGPMQTTLEVSCLDEE